MDGKAGKEIGREGNQAPSAGYGIDQAAKKTSGQTTRYSMTP